MNERKQTSPSLKRLRRHNKPEKEFARVNVVHGNRPTGLTAVILAGAMLLPFGCSTLLKKAPPERSSVPQYAYPTYPGLNAQKKPKSWVDSLLGPEKPEKPTTVGDWMKKSKRINL